MLNHNYIGTEHILLGLIHEGEGVAARSLEGLGVSLEDVRADVKRIIGQGQPGPTGHIPFTPRSKKVLELSMREALQLGHNYIGTEHILLGLVREGEGVGAQVLQKEGATLDRVREEVLSVLGDSGTTEVPSEPGSHEEPRCPRCRTALADSAAYRVLDIPALEEGQRRAVTFAFCRRCGTWLGTLA